MGNTIPEVMEMDKKKQEKINQQKELNKFNAVTQKDKPENQYKNFVLDKVTEWKYIRYVKIFNRQVLRMRISRSVLG